MLQGTPLPPIIQLPPHGASPWVLAQAIALVVATLGGVAGVLLLIRAVARRLSHSPTDGVASAEVAELRDAMQHLTGRVGELEERLDFAERLLARERDTDRLKGPKA